MYQTLKNAPITEAVYDITVIFEVQPTIESLEKIHAEVKNELPVKEEISIFEATFGFSQKGSKTGYQEQKSGFMFKNPDKTNIFQARTNGFSFNRLNPYVNWASFKSDAQKYWRIYSSHVKPKKVIRLALRYINKIEFPFSLTNLDNYFKLGPKISKSAKHDLRGFVLRMNMGETESNNQAIVTLVTEPEMKASSRSVILFDIDTFKVVDLKPNSPKINNVFSQLRKTKNDIFFKNITAKTKALFS